MFQRSCGFDVRVRSEESRIPNVLPGRKPAKHALRFEDIKRSGEYGCIQEVAVRGSDVGSAR